MEGRGAGVENRAPAPRVRPSIRMKILMHGLRSHAVSEWSLLMTPTDCAFVLTALEDYLALLNDKGPVSGA